MARPTVVIPWIRAPCIVKCSFHECCRGWKSGTTGQRFRVDRAEIRSLVTTAVRTGQSQFRRLAAASVLPRLDVLYVESKRGSRCLRKPTIFAAIAGPVPNELTHSRIPITTLPDSGGLRELGPAGS